MADHAVDERTPVLGTTRRTDIQPSSQLQLTPALSSRIRRLPRRPAHLTTAESAVLVTFASIFVVEIALGTSTLAVSSMIESIVCRQRYGDTVLVGHGGGAIDPRCKTPDVQGRLS